MNIGEAIEVLKQGGAVTRKCWSEGRFLYYVPENEYPALTEMGKAIQNESGNVYYKPYIALAKEGQGVSMYVATQDDLLATDWVKYIVDLS